MTDIDIIKDSIDSLGALSVPVALNDTLGAPIARVRNNLIVLFRAIAQKQEEAQKAAEAVTDEYSNAGEDIPDNAEPVIEIEPDEDSVEEAMD